MTFLLSFLLPSLLLFMLLLVWLVWFVLFVRATGIIVTGDRSVGNGGNDLDGRLFNGLFPAKKRPFCHFGKTAKYPIQTS